MSDDRMEFLGTVVNHNRDTFLVRLDGTGDEKIVKVKISGKMRLNKIDIQVDDRVKVEVSPYDTSQGRITSRLRTAKEQRVHEASPRVVDDSFDNDGAH